MRHAVILLLVAMAGCATTLPPAVDVPSGPTGQASAPAPVGPMPTTDRPILDEPLGPAPIIPTIDTAMQQARRTPAPGRFSRGMLRYDFVQPSPLYRLDVAVDKFSTIVLAPGEALYYAGIADTKRWIMDESIAGDGETRRSVLLIKPESEKLQTTILLTTSLGLYHIEAYAHKTSYVAAVAWIHPSRQVAPPPPAPPSLQRYQIRVMTTPAPAWVPSAVWDDGRLSYVRAPEALRVTEAPALSVLSAVPDAEPALVNYRLKGTTFVIDRMLQPGEAFELKSGGQAVRVERKEGAIDDVAARP